MHRCELPAKRVRRDVSEIHADGDERGKRMVD